MIDLFGSLRSTTAILLVGASFSSPMVLHASGHFPNAAKRTSANAATSVEKGPTSPLVVAEHEFAVPQSWGAVPGSQLPNLDETRASTGAIVSGVCPAGCSGGACTGDVGVTFVTYDKAAKFPALSDAEAMFDRDLARSMRGFSKLSATQRTDAGGERFLRYEFRYTGPRGVVRHEVLGVWRAASGTATVAIAVGPERTYARSSRAIDGFLMSAQPSSA